MVQYYTIAGKQIGSHVLAIATLTSTFGLAAFFTRSKPADKAQGPPINAKNKDEESFVKDFIAKAEDKAKSVTGH